MLQSSPVDAYRFGIAEVAPVDSFDSELYNLWISGGLHDSLEYMEKYSGVRANPSLLLDGANSIIVCAFPYPRPSEVEWQPDAMRIASYALGDDYHYVLRRRLNLAVDKMKEQWGGEYRVCIDT
ncbi:MAG: DUF1730 domain-containing protein, partial [Paramuribaculum sp.]|nr:DUF1730 domain-containing protein [Paramuribaculum sp.]